MSSDYSSARSVGCGSLWWRVTEGLKTSALRLTAVGLLLPVLTVCAGESSLGGPGGGGDLRLELVAQGLDSPLYLISPPGDERLFIVEQGGRVRIVKDGELLPRPFLDITDQVLSGGERGLFSLAFHPGYASNGRFFVDYTDLNGDTRVVEYAVSGDPDLADPGSARILLTVEQPFSNHNGGLVLFGPDGFLYVGLGDGGSGGDPLGNGQDPGTLLGSILRVDVDRGSPFAIPPDNPFVGVEGARPEIWAYGLRNPWRFSFDRVTDDLYIADVGQDRFEEVNMAPTGSEGGENYGWNIMEGVHCFREAGCDQEALVLPVLEYDHSDGCSVTGGHVYRGSALPALQGAYFYGDFCGGWVKSFRHQGGEATDRRDWTAQLGRPGQITSFGEDTQGELYIIVQEGRVYRIVAQ